MRVESIEQMKAHRGGYFWLPCVLCRKMFGGHEAHGSLTLTPGSGMCVCPDCKDDANNRNRAFYKVLGNESRDEETHHYRYEHEDEPHLLFLKGCTHGPDDYPHHYQCYHCKKPWSDCLDELKQRSDRILQLAEEMESAECAS